MTLHHCTTATPADEAANVIEMREDSRHLRALFAAELAGVNFTEAEIVTLLNITSGSMLDETMVTRPGILTMNVSDSAAFDVDSTGRCVYEAVDSLLAKVRGFSPTQDAAVCDAIRRFRNIDDLVDMTDALRTVGIVLVD